MRNIPSILFAAALGFGCTASPGTQVVTGTVSTSDAIAVRAITAGVVVTAAQVHSDGTFTLALPADASYRLELLTATGVRPLLADSGTAYRSLEFKVCQPSGPVDMGHVGGHHHGGNGGGGGPSCDPAGGNCPPPPPNCDPTTDANCPRPPPSCDPADPNCAPGCPNPDASGACPPPPKCDPASGVNCPPPCDPATGANCPTPCPNPDASGACPPPPKCDPTTDPSCLPPPPPPCTDPTGANCAPGCPDPDATGACPPKCDPSATGSTTDCPPPPPPPCTDPTDANTCQDPCMGDPANCACPSTAPDCWPQPEPPKCDAAGNCTPPGGGDGMCPDHPPGDIGCGDTGTNVPSPAGA